MSPGDDAPRDPRLLEALRHAPDADAAPPPALSRAILRAAHEAVAAPGWAARALAAWRWLARPPVAAGFASVMLATLVGLMWWGRPIDEGLRAPEPVATAPAAAPGPAPAETSPQAKAPPPSPDAAEAPTVSEVTRIRSPSAAPPMRPAPDRRAAAAPAADASQRRTPEAAAPAAPVATPAAPAVAEAPPARPERHAETRLTDRGLSAGAAGARAPPALDALRTALRAEPQRYRWQRGAGPEQPIDDALTAWLARADAARAGPWQPAAGAPEAAPLAVLRVTAADGAATVITLEGDALRLDAGDRRERAALAPGQAGALRDALP